MRQRPPNVDGKAWCSGHRDYIEIELFYPDLRSARGLDYYCKECRRYARNRWYHLMPPERKEVWNKRIQENRKKLRDAEK